MLKYFLSSIRLAFVLLALSSVLYLQFEMDRSQLFVDGNYFYRIMMPTSTTMC